MPNEDEYSNPAEETEETSVAEAPTPTNLSEAFEILKKQNSNVDSGNEEEVSGYFSFRAHPDCSGADRI